MALKRGFLLITLGFFLVLSIFLLPKASSFNIGVEVQDAISGSTYEMVSGDYQLKKISIFWQNTGSVGCLVRPRVDFYSDSVPVKKSWGNEKQVFPGKEGMWEVYAYLDPGSYEYRIRIYACNEISDSDYKAIVAKESVVDNSTIQIKEVKTFGDRVEIYIKSSKSLGKIIAIPDSYPGGWIIDNAYISNIKENSVEKLDMFFTPLNFSEKTISVTIADENGENVLQRSIFLKMGESQKSQDTEKLLVVVLLVIAIIGYLYISKR